jgi:uncharacterized protein YdaU (DUF1376 family)
MRTSRMAWFKVFVADLVADPEWLEMSSAARGALFTLYVYGWLELAKDRGLSADPKYLQRITNTTPKEWDAIKSQVLANLELKADGRLYPHDLCAQMDNATGVWQAKSKAGKAAKAARDAAAEKKNAPKNLSDDDEIRLDQIRLDYYEHAPEHSSECSDEHSSASPSVVNAGISPLHGSPTSGHLAAPTSGVPLPSASKAPQEMLNPDIVRVREAAFKICGKLPNPTDIARLLDRGYSADEMIEAFDNYANDGDERDLAFAEFNFFGQNGSGGEVVMNARRKEAVARKR